MDLLNTVRKSGSRGGVNFSWSDVASSSHRENYLGHSLMAPVGRWQQGRDLSWYAKGDGDKDDKDGNNETAEERAARERRDEMRKVKEAEEDAMARALGLPPPQRDVSGANAIEVDAPKRILGPAAPETKDDAPDVDGEGKQDIDMVAKTQKRGNIEGLDATGAAAARGGQDKIDHRAGDITRTIAGHETETTGGGGTTTSLLRTKSVIRSVGTEDIDATAAGVPSAETGEGGAEAGTIADGKRLSGDEA